MICYLPSSFTPSFREQHADLALLSTTTRNVYDTFDALTGNRSRDSLQWRQSKEQNASLVQEERQEVEFPLKSAENTGVPLEVEKNTKNGSCHGAQQGEEEEQEEVTIIGQSNHHASQAGSVDNITLGALLKAYTEQRNLLRGGQIHAEIIKQGSIEKNVFLGTSLVNFYVKCSELGIAERVFYDLPVRSIVSWNVLIGGYAQHMHTEKALSCYYLMQEEGLSPDTITFLSVLKACASLGVPDVGQGIHAHIVTAGLLEDTRVSTALVDMYAKNGALEKAHQVFNSVMVRDVVLWTALILGYAEHEYGEEALQCYEQMQLEGLIPDAFTSVCILKACGSIGVAYEGQKIHAELVWCEMLENDMVAGSALVDMYANCGMLAEAQDVFDSLSIKNVVAWSALMEGYAQLGKDEVVFRLFDGMVRSGSKPTWVTFTILLNACCHRGLVDKGMAYFEMISNDYRMVPTIEHYTCMGDLFCRAGHIDKVVVMIMVMSLSANLTLWNSLLDACQKGGNIKLGRWTFGRVVEVDGTDAAAYVCLSNFPARRQTTWTRTRR